MMLDGILKKLGVSSLEEFFKREDEFLKRFDGLEIEYESSLSKLTIQELDFVDDYIVEHRANFT